VSRTDVGLLEGADVVRTVAAHQHRTAAVPQVKHNHLLHVPSATVIYSFSILVSCSRADEEEYRELTSITTA
jgi:hypothetical protein